MICELCGKKRKAFAKCEICGDLYCEECYDLSCGECGCQEPTIFPIRK